MGDKEVDPILSMEGICKSFPGVKALDGVDFSLWPKEVHALVGENGAGKSTLIKILAGVYKMDSGKILVEGRPVDISSPRQAQEHGISVVHQEFTLVPQMTVAENIMLSNMPSIPGLRSLVDKKTMVYESEKILNGLGVDIDVFAPVRLLTMAEQQIVEIAKALSGKTRILVMDEPTAALSNVEVERLFDVIRTLILKGIAVIYISHKLEEVFRISHRITVLRDGRVVSSSPISEVTRNEVVKQMVGRELTTMYDRCKADIGGPAMEVKGLLLDPAGEPISFTVHEGEILGIAGLMGAGQIQLARALFGIGRTYGGEVLLRGRPASLSSPSKAVRSGVGLVTENRNEEGLVQLLSVSKNITITVLDAISRRGVLSSWMEDRIVTEKIEELDIRTPSPKQPVMNLSGGNQQKVVLAKWLAVDPDVMIMCEPTRGIDVGAKAEIYRLIGGMAKNGKAVLLISSEIPEVVGMSDRVLVLHSGRVVGELMGDECTQEAVLRLATGGSVVGA
ncbi:MAG: sugar ABC transporter ATP-binding protein [Bacillota bacterium]|jgi:ribose transport system ATP-binding protein